MDYNEIVELFVTLDTTVSKLERLKNLSRIEYDKILEASHAVAAADRAVSAVFPKLGEARESLYHARQIIDGLRKTIGQFIPAFPS